MTSMLLRLSQRLARKIESRELAEATPHPNPCADWSCRLFVAKRTEYLLVSNTLSMYSCVFPSAGVTDRELLSSHILDAVGKFLASDDQEASLRQVVAAANAGVIFAQPLDRFTAVSMSDHVHSVKLYLADGLEPNEIGLRLNSTRIALRNHSRRRHFVKPRDAFMALSPDRH